MKGFQTFWGHVCVRFHLPIHLFIQIDTHLCVTLLCQDYQALYVACD